MSLKWRNNKHDEEINAVADDVELKMSKCKRRRLNIEEQRFEIWSFKLHALLSISSFDVTLRQDLKMMSFVDLESQHLDEWSVFKTREDKLKLMTDLTCNRISDNKFYWVCRYCNNSYISDHDATWCYLSFSFCYLCYNMIRYFH